jgi:tetratricopeptide (TPR) repeat protein
VVKFVGRAEKLEQLHSQLQQNERIAITAIAGMGGIGKTELALQYAIDQKNQCRYPAGLCWLRARDREIATELLTFAQTHLGLSIPEQLEIDAQVRFCWQHWPQGEALVVLDDVTNYRAIEPYLPPADPRFKLLITTRLDLGRSVQKVPLEELDEDGSIALLESLVGAERVRSQLVDAEALCKWVGYLPLALELLGRFLARKLDWSIGRLLKALEDKRLEAKALVETENGMTGQLGVAAALELSWQELNEAERELACVLGMFAIAPIPWSLVEKCVVRLKDTFLTRITNFLIRKNNRLILDGLYIEDFRDNGLMARHLLKWVGDDRYQLHQIVQEYFRIKLGERIDQGQTIKANFWHVMVGIAQSIDSSPTTNQIEQVRESITHLEEGVRSWIDSITDENLTWPFVSIGNFYEGQGNYYFAEFWRRDCLEIAEKRLGEEHPHVAESLNNLAELYRSQGKYNEAEPLYRSALDMNKSMLGEKHPSVATSLNNLALLYYLQGKYKEAEPLYCWALVIKVHMLGEEHPSVAMSLNNLAVLYKSQGKYEEAEPLYRSALNIKVRMLGEEHLDVATSQNNLAGLYKLQGKYEKAEYLYRSALEMNKRLLGEEHPNVATSQNNLALFYEAQGKYEEAELLCRSALEMKTRLLGEEHPNVATSQNNLALLYEAQGKYEEAEPLCRSALEMKTRLLGEEHPDVATSQWNLGVLYQKQGRHLEAEALYRQALVTAQSKLGSDHPDTQGILSWLNSLPQPPA